MAIDVVSRRPEEGGEDEESSTKKKAEGEYSASDDVVYLYCPRGYGRTKLNNKLFLRKFGVRVTTWNWGTLNSILNL